MTNFYKILDTGGDDTNDACAEGDNQLEVQEIAPLFDVLYGRKWSKEVGLHSRYALYGLKPDIFRA